MPVAPDARGAGYQLLETLVRPTERAGIWTIQSGIFPENTASLALTPGPGSGPSGPRGIGCHHGWWRDVLLIERRSPAI